MDEQETTKPEFMKGIELKKEYELKEENKIYKLKIELDKDEIIFELNLISELSYYNYIKRYDYNDLRKKLNLPTNIYNNLTKIFNYIDLIEYKIIDGKGNKKIIINNKDKIILDENKNKDIINLLINEINNIKEINNKQDEKINNLIKLNIEKDTQINNLKSKYEELMKELSLISNNKTIYTSNLKQRENSGYSTTPNKIPYSNMEEKKDTLINYTQKELDKIIKIQRWSRRIIAILKGYKIRESLISQNKKNYANKLDGRNKINFKFNKDKIDLKIDIENAKYICVNDIIIENIGEKDMIFDKLYFAIDKNKSDKDITFSDVKNLYVYQLPTKKGIIYGKPENFNITLKIDSPKIDKTYTAYFYIKDNNKENSPKLSNPFIINIKLLKKEEINQIKMQKDEANKLYDEYNKLYKLSELCSKEEVIKNFLELKNEKILIEKWINVKMEEKEKKIKQLYDELNIVYNFENYIFNKNDILNKFKELNFDKEKIIKWIESEIEINVNKALIIYHKLNFPNPIDEIEAIRKIISENFNEENINNWITNWKIDQEENLLVIFNEEYSILKFLTEDKIIKKIRELDYNIDKINEWVKFETSKFIQKI